ncbi:hypothetical protein [Pseudomonas sp. R5-89-07]|uniref:hypothetical protein n=1 Tax=Pseudomonas sp. R5-89-07 TaxID=658644 RepID=UPI000F57FB51|nr:hypothetical protein [Pseudomonas sp. R5-89-07]AZF03159.1 hypothetical protein C4J94_0360 [Pseudomonas sp. R5-89-07]
MTSSPPTTEEQLRQLSACATSSEHLLDAQPRLATLMASHLRHALATLMPTSPPNPNEVFLNEYVYDTPSTDTPGTRVPVPRVTRSNSLTQVLHEAIATQRVPTQLAKEQQGCTVSQAVGFYRHFNGAGRDGEITSLEVAAFNKLISDMQQDSLGLYLSELEAFWTSPHVGTCALSVHDAISQKQRQMFVIEADLKLHDARQQRTPARLKIVTEGRQLIENLITHENSGNATPAQKHDISLYSTQQPEWCTALNGCFVLTERIHAALPTVLYTPQFGVEIFEQFSVMENALRQRLLNGTEKTQLLANVAASERTRANEVLTRERNLRYAPITGQVFSQCLQAHRNQQAADINHLFSTSHTTFEALATKLLTPLALPLKGNPALLARMPEATPVAPLSAHTPPDIEQQTSLIRLWNSLNEQIGDVLDKHKHPSLESALKSLLKETFAQLAPETKPSSLYVNRYRIDSLGQRHFEASQTLSQRLCALLRWENIALNTEEPEDQAAQQAQDVTDGTVTEGVFSTATAFSATDQIAQNGTLLELAETMQARLAEQVSTYWRTPIAPELACPQARLIDVYRQVLDVQARLGKVDNTLSPRGKQLIDQVLLYPTQARREAAFTHGCRPGVYQLTVSTGTADGARLAGSFVLASTDGASPVQPHWPFGHKWLSTQGVGGTVPSGVVLLYTPDQGFEEFATLQSLHDTLKTRIDVGEDAGKALASGLPLSVQQTKAGLWGGDLRNIFAPIESDFVADTIQTLLDKQQADIQALLGLAEGETDLEYNGRAQMIDSLDMAAPFLARDQRFLEHWQPDWEKRLSPTERQTLQDLATTAQAKQDELSEQWQALIPTLAEYAKEQVLLKIRAFLAEKGPSGHVRAGYPAEGIDPDKIIVIRTTKTRIKAEGGFGTLNESVTSQQISLTNLLLKNNKPWERSLHWTEDDLLEATLVNAQGRTMRDAQGRSITLGKERLEQWVTELNISHEYIENVLKKHLAPDTTNAAGQALQKAWIESQASALNYAALVARLSPDAYSTTLVSNNLEKKGAAWVAAVLTDPDPKTRQKVDGQAVVANALMFNPIMDSREARGGQTVNGVLILSTDTDTMTVLFTPNAPDLLELREIASETDLVRLMRSPAWQDYLKARLPDNTRLRTYRLAAHAGDLLPGLYRQNYLHLLDKTDTESVTNEELNDQSVANKVLFGVEVVTTALSGFPWAGRLTSSAFQWLGRIGRTTVQTLRNLGHSAAGLIMRRRIAGRVLFEVASATTMVTGVARSSGLGVKPLQMLLKPAKRTPLSGLTAHQRAFQQESANLAVPGGIPADTSLAEGTGIYRTAGSPTTLLVRSTSETGRQQVFRIQNSFNLHDPNGLVAPLLKPSGGWTPFRLRRLPNKNWVLDTFERAPGGTPPAHSNTTEALREWQAQVNAHAQSTAPQAALDPAAFFRSRGIPVGTWNKFVRQSGSINARGLHRINPNQGHAPLTDELFMKWVELGQETREAATHFVLAHNIHPAVWAQYVTKWGSLTSSGAIRTLRLSRLAPGIRSTITDQHLLDWDKLYLRPPVPRTTPITRNDVVAYAIEKNIRIDTWMRYVSSINGEFRLSVPKLPARLQRLGITSTPPPAAPPPGTTSPT